MNRNAQKLTFIPFKMAVGATNSEGRAANGLMLVFVAPPTGTTAASYTLQASLDGASYTDYLDETGTAISITVGAGEIAAFPTKGIIAPPYLRLVGNTAQLTADVTIQVATLAV